MPYNRNMGWFNQPGESFTQLDIGPFNFGTVNTVSLVRVRGGITWTASDVADFGPFPAFVIGVQYGDQGYTPWAIDNADGYQSWFFLGHCLSPSNRPVLDTITTPNAIGESDTLDAEWHGQLNIGANTDFYVTVAVNPGNESGVEDAFILGSLEMMNS
jgi:hypothetical protein